MLITDNKLQVNHIKTFIWQLLKAEGSHREYNMPVMIDLKESGTLTKTVTVEYPLRTVPGSERVELTVIGKSVNGYRYL